MVGHEETGFGVTLFLDGISCPILTPHFVLLISCINVNRWWRMRLKMNQWWANLHYETGPQRTF